MKRGNIVHMAVVALIPVEEYLSTAYRPDCDYIDGEIHERNVGERDHSRTQREILIEFESSELAHPKPRMKRFRDGQESQGGAI